MTTNTKKPRLTQEERSRLSTEKLINACIEIASDQGANAITFDTIGERAGYSRNLAFQKFGSKSALLEAVINYLHEQVLAAQAKGKLDGLSGLEAIYVHCESQFIALNRGNAMRAYSILQSAAISELSDTLTLFEEANKRSGRAIKSLLKRGIEDGSIRKDIDVDQAVLIIGSQLHGISSEAIVESNIDIQPVLSELRNVIARAYGAPGHQDRLLQHAIPFAEEG